MSTPGDAVTVQGVGRWPVLRDVTFAVPAGAVVALLGRNGAGKTTLLRAVAGLLRPDGGTVSVFGRPVAEVLPRIGYVGQAAPLYPMLTVAQTLRLGARLNPRWEQPYAPALPPSAKVGTLSAGQRTRLALAMALGKQPDLLILDEPLAGLDPVARTETIGALMATVAERGTTVLMSTHVVADIEGVCDRVVVLGEGRVRLAAGIEPALAEHRILVGATRQIGALDGLDIVELRRDHGEFTALVRNGMFAGPGFLRQAPSLEELLLGYLRDEEAA